MANVSEVEFEAVIPFNWMTELDANEAIMFSSWLLGPSTGLRHEFEFSGYKPNENGGRTAMYVLRIEGTEAIWSRTLKAWMEAIERIGGEIRLCTHTDLEWDPENVQTTVLARTVV